jgi:hypothetical protein
MRLDTLEEGMARAEESEKFMWALRARRRRGSAMLTCFCTAAGRNCSNAWKCWHSNRTASWPAGTTCAAAAAHVLFVGVATQNVSVVQVVKKRVASELKLFERDLQEYLQERACCTRSAVAVCPLSLTHARADATEHRHEAPADGTTRTAIGRTHFRCLTCNSVVQRVEGPSTDVLGGPVAGNVTDPPPEPFPASRQIKVGNKFVVETGTELPILGFRGEVYKGRQPDRVVRTVRPPTATGLRPTSARPRKAGAPGSVGTEPAAETLPSPSVRD